MSRFRRLTLDEARQTFPLINEEARKALKGGCDTCENWKIENPGIVIYSVGEWEEMSKNGNWTVGAVCGEGLMVGPNTVVYGPPRPPLCAIHPHFYGKNECLYCYFDGFQHCDEHKIYFPFTKDCRECYYDQNYYNLMNYNNQTGNTTGGGSSGEDPNTVVNGENQNNNGSPPKIDFAQKPFTALLDWFKYIANNKEAIGNNTIYLRDFFDPTNAAKNGITLSSPTNAQYFKQVYSINNVGTFEVKIYDSEITGAPNSKYANAIEEIRCINSGTKDSPNYVFKMNNSNYDVVTIYCGSDENAFLWLYKRIYGENAPINVQAP